MEERAVIEFDGWSLHTDSGELNKGTTKVRLQEQSLQFLLELLAHPGQVVTREQLIARLWPKGVVDFDTSLNSVVRKLRVALGDNATTPRYIETIPRKGYRFIYPLAGPQEPAAASGVRRTLADTDRTAPAEIAPMQGAASAASLVTPDARPADPAVRSWKAKRSIYALILMMLFAVTGGVIAAVLAMRPESERPVLAVLPLLNLSRDPANQLLCGGLAEELANVLVQIPELGVVPRTSAFAVRERAIGVAAIGRELKASHVIDGRLVRKSRGLRIDLWLVRTSDGARQWEGSFDVGAADKLSIQNRVTKEVAEALRLRITPQTWALLAERQTDSELAFDHYMNARQLWRQRAPEANEKAIEFFGKAIVADRNYALAYVGLAEAYLNRIYLKDAPREEVAEAAGPQIEAAMRLNSQLPEVLAAKGWLLAEQSQLDQAARWLRQALAMNLNDADVRGKLARVLSRLGQPRLALDQARLAAELDPFDANVHLQQCFILQDLAEFDSADRECKLALSLQPESYWGHYAKVQLRRNEGRLDEALQENQRALQLDREDSLLLTWHIELQLMLGLDDEAERTHGRSVRVPPGAYDRSLVGILLVRYGKKALLEYLQSVDPTQITSQPELIDLAKAYHVAGDSGTSIRLFKLAGELPGSQETFLLDPTEVANEYSGSLYLAAARFANGEHAAANKELDALEALLDRLEADGVDCHGLHSLRAQAHVLRGNHDAAMVSLQRAVKQGWLWAWRARHEPYLSPLQERRDYQALMAEVERRITKERDAVIARRQGK